MPLIMYFLLVIRLCLRKSRMANFTVLNWNVSNQSREATSTLSRINLKTQLFYPDRPSVHTKTAFSVSENGTF